MTDKRSESERPSARPPLPSIAPPTDDIDSEWGADEIPAAPRAPQVAAPTPVAPAPISTSRASEPPRPSTPAAAPRPASSVPPAPRPSSPAPSAAPAPYNPLRKQTLLGIAPVIPPRSEPPPRDEVARSEPPRAETAPPTPPQAASAPASTPPPAENPLRKRTLLGIAPVVPPPPNDAASSDAPVTRDVARASNPPAPSTSTPSTSAPELSPSTRAPAVAVSPDDDDLPQLRSRRSRWLLPLAAAALLGVAYFALERLDRAPEQQAAIAPAPAPKPPAAAPTAEPGKPSPQATPSSASTPGDADEASAPAAGDSAITNGAPAASAAAATDESSGAVKSVSISSDPPGARMYRKGKEVGRTPFVLEIPEGQRRSFELDLPGFVTRKVVIDGSESEVRIGLRPDSGASTGASPRK